jgi:hypothetical protein
MNNCFQSNLILKRLLRRLEQFQNEIAPAALFLSAPSLSREDRLTAAARAYAA